jgi:DNA-binding protein H-NS
MATTLEAIQAKMKKLQAQADALMTKETAKALATIHRLMEEHGLTTADIDTHTGGKQRAKPATSVAKYRDPKSGATWSGHGRAPGWIASAKNRDKFLVDGSTALLKPVHASKAKTAGNYVRGPQPALYRDPKSGATWSGRGRAPAWLANVKDRSKFLIAGGAEATVATTAGTVSKGKAGSKKAASKAVGATGGKGQRKGPQPAMYRDPKSGVTWSGRGRAPAWLASAKDRSKFFIGGVAVGATDAGAVGKGSTPKAAAKKSVTKKAVARRATPVKNAVAGKKAPVKKSLAARKVRSADAVSASADSTGAPAAAAVLSA